MKSILFAPGVHHGGGLVLLTALCRDWPVDHSVTAFLDERARGRIPVPAGWQVHWVPSSFVARFSAEVKLRQESLGARLVFCFHNLPPVFACAAPVVCYVQNPNLVGLSRLSNFSGWIRLRLIMERFIARVFRGNVDQYVVQTPTMARTLKAWLGAGPRGREPSICQMPFVNPEGLTFPSEQREAETLRQWDFIYVSDGQAHKNHRRLFEAWILLSQEGLRPLLAVTLHPVHDAALAQHLEDIKRRHELNITNLGHMPHADVLGCYRRAGAMLFASYAESFGVPFLEARAAELPILAAELDFVRDMCEPVQTFDPFSVHSIVRAVKRHLGKSEKPLQPLTAATFISGLLSAGRAAS